MSKQEMLIEYNIQDIVEYISKDNGVDYDEAMRLFYASEVFEKLNDPETGLYLESPAYIYDLFRSEKSAGKIVQAEI
jgi:PhoPQ-activated pathogenicity-related protein